MSDRQNEQDRQDVSFNDPQAAREHVQSRGEYLKNVNKLRLTRAEVAKLFQQEEAKLRKSEAPTAIESEADAHDTHWNTVSARPVTPELYERLSQSRYFSETATGFSPSAEGINILLALACWDEQVDSRAPRHCELEYIYQAGFNAALAALCAATAAETIDDLSPYFTSNTYLRVLRDTIGAQFAVNTALMELGVDVHPDADYAAPIEPSRRGRRRTPNR